MQTSTETKFLIYVDVLGFEELSKQIAKDTNQYPAVVRETYFEKPFKECIETHQDLFQTLTSGTDDCLLLVNDADTTIKCMDIFSTIPLNLPNFSFIPVEIALDYVEVDSRVKNPINSDNVISALKNNILRLYKNDYTDTNNGKKIENTFIIATPKAYEKIIVLPIKRQTKLQKKKYVQIPQDFLLRERTITTFFENLRIEKSDYSGSFIDKIYIEPDEFEVIQKKLHADRLIFVTGPPGFGKTYLAIRLLWLGFNAGYTPKWIRCNDKSGISQKEFIEFFDANVKDKDIVYIEDPFGRITFRQNDELVKRLSTLIDFVKRKDILLIFTSRKDVFEAFERSCYTPEKIHSMEQELNVISPSYDYKKREEICKKWADEKGCLWFHNRKLKNLIFNSLKDHSLLSTPLSIHDFTQATVMISEENQLVQKIYEYSREAWSSFGEEIAGLCESGRVDHILLLSLVFITDGSGLSTSYSFFEDEYNQLKKQGHDDFEIVFKDEKHRFSIAKRNCESKSPDDDIVRFAHPIYLNSLDYLIKNTCFRTIFFQVIEHLYLKNSQDVLRIVNKYYLDFPTQLRKRILYNCLLENILYDSEVISTITIDKDLIDLKRKIPSYIGFISSDVLSPVVRYFSQLPNSIQQLFFIVSKKEKNLDSLSLSLLSNPQYLSYELNDLLIQLCEGKETSRHISEALFYRYSAVPEDLRLKLTRILVLNPKNHQIASILLDHYDTLPSDITDNLIAFANTDDCTWDLSEGIICYYEQLPQKIQKLLFKLANRSKTSDTVAAVLGEYYNRFLQPEREKLLKMLSRKKDAITGVAFIFCVYYKDIPQDLRTSIFNILNNRDNIKHFSREIAFNYQKVPKHIKELLFKYASDDETAYDVAYAILDELEEQDDLPTKIQEKLLLKLSVQPSAKDIVISTLYNMESHFSFEFISKVLKKLVNENWGMGDFSLPLLCHYDKFDPDLRAAMFEETVMYDPHGVKLKEVVDKYREMIPNTLIEFWLEEKKS